jgi:hypothetical protein
MTAADSSQVSAGPFERLFRALRDDASRDRAVFALLVGYTAVWAIYATISRSSQGLHPDMTELIAWSRDLSFGYLKHPPLAAWLVRFWFSVFPLTDGFYYLLAALMPTTALWFFWRLSADYLDIDKRIVGLTLLTFIPFYNFLALKLNANTVLLPTWAAATFCFLRSYRTGSAAYGAATGLSVAACMLAKYWSVFLLAGFFVAALTDPRRLAYFRSPAPWIAAVVAVGALSPHLLWLYQHGFAPFEYAMAKHTANSFFAAAIPAVIYLAGSLAYAVVPIALVLLIARPGWATLADMIWPADRERRLVAFTFYAPLVLPLGSALADGANLTPLWSMPAFTLLPIVLLSPQTIQFRTMQMRRILHAAIILPLLMLIAAPAVALVVHLAGTKSVAAAQGPLLAAEVERAWHEETPAPLRFVGCDAANVVVAYAQEKPRAMPMRALNGDIGDTIYAQAHGWPRPADDTAQTEAQALRSGAALACQGTAGDWISAAERYAAAQPKSRRFDVNIVDSFLGIAGSPQHYIIFIVPPQT